MTNTGKTGQPIFPSIDDVKPDEEGGPIARVGFNYQDEIAVGFLVEMLENPSLLKVHCETQDDIVLVRTVNGIETHLAEFVQVKSNASKLWSVADLCARKKNTVGTSIFETSLLKDKCGEESRFRLVSLLPVAKELEVLTFPCEAPGRETESERLKLIKSELDRRCPGVKSGKGNGADFWIKHFHWDVRHREEDIQNNNLMRLIRLSNKEERQLLLEHAETLLRELRDMAKSAACARWEPDRNKKIITREMLRDWWGRRARELTEGAAAPGSSKLTEKMTEAGLPSDLIRLAIELRRDYASAVRSSHYMETTDQGRLQRRVKAEVVSLRARLVAGQLNADGAAFHTLCLDRMDVVNAERTERTEDQSAFLKGCLYDMADRCFLRFSGSAK